MTEPKFEDIESWLIENADKEGTTDYVHMAGAYKALDPKRTAGASAAPTKSFGEDMWGRAKLAFGMSPEAHAAAGGAEAVPNLEDIMAAKRLTQDPRSFDSRASRILTGAMGGAPDLGIGLYNAGARTIGSPESQVEYLTPQMQANAGTPDLPADAPLYERLGEAAGSAFLGGGAGAAGSALNTARATAQTTGAALPVASTVARMAAPTVVPTVAGHYGGEAGASLGERFSLDQETTALLGSLLGGAAHTIGPVARTAIHQLYAPQGAANAPQIADMARRQGATPTAGMLGNDNVLRREQVLSGQPGGSDVIQNARTAARTQIGNAYDQSAAARGSVDTQPTPGTIGEKINTAARESAETLREASDTRQARLNEQIPQDTPVQVLPIQERGYGQMADPGARLTPTDRAAIDYRLTEQLNQLVDRDAGGQPMLSPMPGQQPAGMGHNGGPPMGPMSQTAPYGDVAGFRTELGRDVSTPAGGRMPAVTSLYEPTTAAMRDAAERAGVRPGNFDAAQNMTRDIMREQPTTPGGPQGDYHALLDYIKQNPEAAFNNLNNRGQQDPAIPGILEATGHRGIGEVFGDWMRNLGNDTINSPQTSPQGGARGTANFANALTKMNRESRATMLGDQLGNVSDQVGLAQALNIPTSQAGLTRGIGGQGNSVANKVLGSEALAQLGGHYLGPLGALAGRIVGMLAPSDIRARRAGVLEGPTVRNALEGGPGPGGINQLGAALAAIQADQQQRRGAEAVR